MTEQKKVWFLREVASEDCFAEDLRDQCSQVRANMEKMMLELERLRGCGATLDCLERSGGCCWRLELGLMNGSLFSLMDLNGVLSICLRFIHCCEHMANLGNEPG
ncbi:hypothetical protein Tco_0895702 [Tanacetum coccineum]|uniref:Uncharacterized protein n=1 Tax=Tanacetum coccineum TaxID=301880 RepID=A0ABQ5CFC1_9ASTR